MVCDRCHATRWARHLPRTPAPTGSRWPTGSAPTLTGVGISQRLRWLLRDFLHAGWTADDLLHALDTHPDTGPYPYATTVPGAPGGLRNPAGWVLHRLKPWRDPDGTPVTPCSATHAAAVAARRAAQLAAERRAAAPATEPPTVYQAARAGLRRVGGRPPPGHR